MSYRPYTLYIALFCTLFSGVAIARGLYGFELCNESGEFITYQVRLTKEDKTVYTQKRLVPRQCDIIRVTEANKQDHYLLLIYDDFGQFLYDYRVSDGESYYVTAIDYKAAELRALPSHKNQ